MRLKNKTVGILVDNGFEDLEFWVPLMRMQEEGATIMVIGTRSGETYQSKSGGLTARSEVASSQVSADRLDALLVPGGWAPDKLRRDPDILKLVQDLNSQSKIMGFICHAGWVAASAKICQGRRVTGTTGIKDDMENAGAIWVDAPAFREENLVWGRVVADIPNYCRELVRAISQ